MDVHPSLLIRKIIAYGIVKALSIVHQKHCAYWDLKMANVLIEEWEYNGQLLHRPRLCDFSTGRNIDILSSKGISHGNYGNIEHRIEPSDPYGKDFEDLRNMLVKLLPEYKDAINDVTNERDIQIILFKLKDLLDTDEECWKEYLRCVDVEPDFNPRPPDVVRKDQAPSDKLHE